jgi:glycosyltransferase involved in cell wall biosynthesis
VSRVPLVTVITPAWGRRKMLLQRCIPSVQLQGYPRVEHIVVSDGPDPGLRDILSAPWQQGWKDLRYAELPEHPPDPHYGVPARLEGLVLANGDYITYCDDDDSLRPLHCSLLAKALDENPEAGFAVSQMLSHQPGGDVVVGSGAGLTGGQVGTPMIMHRAGLAAVSTWGPSGAFEDWELVARWLEAGVAYVRVLAQTCDAWPSLFRGAGPDPEPETWIPQPMEAGEPQVWPDGAERATVSDLARPQI